MTWWLQAGLTAITTVVLLIPATGNTQSLDIINLDDPGEGLNDPEERVQVGGNNGTTLGEQRLIVLEAAAARWEEFLDLTIDLRVGSSFDPLDCSSNSAILGQAGPESFRRDFPARPVANTWYAIAQADTLDSTDNAAGNHIDMTFNSTLDVDDDTCLGTGGDNWYYGLDGVVPSGKIALLPVVLHELAHGLGFTTIVNLETGERADNRNDAYMLHLFDTETDTAWPDMTDSERVNSAINNPNVVWSGTEVGAHSDMVTQTTAFSDGLLRMHAPGELEVGSSISHWTTDADPPLLMEPIISSQLFDSVDLTPALFMDLGWPVTTVLQAIFQDRFEDQNYETFDHMARGDGSLIKQIYRLLFPLVRSTNR